MVSRKPQTQPGKLEGKHHRATCILLTTTGASQENYKEPGRDTPSFCSDSPAPSTDKGETLTGASSNITRRAMKDIDLELALITDRYKR